MVSSAISKQFHGARFCGGPVEFPTNSGRSIKRVIVHARSVRNVEEISETGPS
jgi:hypothetical protein